MALSRITARNVGTAVVPLNAAVPAGKSWTVIGLSICNKLSQAISIDLYVTDSTPADTYVCKSFVIPAGETFLPWGQLGKGVMIAGDVLKIVANVANACDVYMPYYEE